MFRKGKDGVLQTGSSAARSRGKHETLGMVWMNPGERGKVYTCYPEQVIGRLIRHINLLFSPKAYCSKYKVGESEIAVQRSSFMPFPQFHKSRLSHLKCENVCVTYGIVRIQWGSKQWPPKDWVPQPLNQNTAPCDRKFPKKQDNDTYYSNI